VLQDFSLFVRLALAGAADVIKAQALCVTAGLRGVEGEVESGEWDNLRRNKRWMEDEGDVKIKFEHRMVTQDPQGNRFTVIGARASAEGEADKAWMRVQDMYYQVCDICFFEIKFCF